MSWLFQICDSDDFDFGTLNTDGFCADSKSRLSASVCLYENGLDHFIIAYIHFEHFINNKPLVLTTEF